MTLYAAYGTNLDPARMSERCPHSPLQTTGWLLGWRLTFGGEELGWDGALATIVEDLIRLLDGVGEAYRHGRRPDGKAAKPVASLLRAVADELEA